MMICMFIAKISREIEMFSREWNIINTHNPQITIKIPAHCMGFINVIFEFMKHSFSIWYNQEIKCNCLKLYIACFSLGLHNEL